MQSHFYIFRFSVKVSLLVRSVCVTVCSYKKYTTFTYFIMYYFALYGECRLCSRGHSSELEHLLKIEVCFLSLKAVIVGSKSVVPLGYLIIKQTSLQMGQNHFEICVTLMNKWKKLRDRPFSEMHSDRMHLRTCQIPVGYQENIFHHEASKKLEEIAQ